MTEQTSLPAEITREKRRQELESTSFSTGSQGGALMQPRNGKELMDMANMMSASGQMVRDFYRGNPGDCAALIMICQPYGFNPFMVSWKTYKASKNADAPVSFEGQLVNAMVNQSAPVRGRLRYKYDGEGPTRTCTVVGIDRETGEEIIYTSPQLKDIPVKNSPLWKGDPDQQLGYYSARSWARRHFPELLLGVYTREEIEEAPIRDVTPKDTAFTRLAEKARGKTETEQPATAPESAAQADQDISEAEIADEPEPSPYEALDTDDAAPGSQAWDRGLADWEQGNPIEACPYDLDTPDAVDYCGAWKMAARAKE